MTSRSITGRDPETGDSLTVQVTNGHIDCIEKLNYSVDSYISAGLIDLQVNGFKGLDLNDGNLNNCNKMLLILIKNFKNLINYKLKN